ncbi:MAG: 4Fe-4S binding protein [Lachnospiraceae bacterium]|nr:4Fe-4S binding protein [Lachnospiraceae bacterium]
MIFYFSATGNDQHIAKTIGTATGETTVDISKNLKEGKFIFFVQKGEMLGLVTPTYFGGLPRPVCEFLEKLQLQADEKPYTFYIASYGITNGKTGQQADQYFEQKGFSLDARFSIRMPDTWTPIFNLSKKEKVSKKIACSENELKRVTDKITTQSVGDFMKRKTPKVLGDIYYQWAYTRYGTTNWFTVNENCVGCGLCAKNCPVSAIDIKAGKPVWIKAECATCLGCLHNCPRFAIDYGKNTRRHGQYHYPQKN